ncbi:hypothetical protein K439DRAFT_147281 [Ramaria rubella]|nr:hypothetical protein K439DRAFT_147281 [Ramaria rubella]
MLARKFLKWALLHPLMTDCLMVRSLPQSSETLEVQFRCQWLDSVGRSGIITVLPLLPPGTLKRDLRVYHWHSIPYFLLRTRGFPVQIRISFPIYTYRI